MTARACSTHWKQLNTKISEKPKGKEVAIDVGIHYRKIGCEDMKCLNKLQNRVQRFGLYLS